MQRTGWEAGAHGLEPAQILGLIYWTLVRQSSDVLGVLLYTCEDMSYTPLDEHLPKALLG